MSAIVYVIILWEILFQTYNTKNFTVKAVKSQETKNFTLIIIIIAGTNFIFVSYGVSLTV